MPVEPPPTKPGGPGKQATDTEIAIYKIDVKIWKLRMKIYKLELEKEALQ